MLTKAQKSHQKESWIRIPLFLLMIVFCFSFLLYADTGDLNQDKISQSDKLQKHEKLPTEAQDFRRENSEKPFIPLSFLKSPDILPGSNESQNIHDKYKNRYNRIKRTNNAGFATNVNEKPHIKLDLVPEDAYIPGLISIKLTQQARSQNLAKLITSGKGGYAITDIPELDELNQVFRVKKYENNFDKIYQTSPASIAYKDRHQAWGLDLYWLLTIEPGTDIIEVAKSFQALDIVEIAEPIYKKRQIPVESSIIKGELENESKYIPNDPLYSLNQWHFDNTGQTIGGQTGTPGCDISAEEAWDIEKGWSDVIVAVFDGGIDIDHEDIAGNMWPGYGPDGSSTVADDHGTHTSGTISAVMNNSTGVASIAGGSGSGDGVRLMTIDIFTGSETDPYLFRDGNTYAADNGAAISQNSWGYTAAGVYNSYDLTAIDYFNTNGGGTVLVGGITIFAAGNDNEDNQWYPGYYSGAMAVAGTDNRDQRYTSSNYGSWVEISAPAVNVASTVTMENADGEYLFYTGTSMACPHVSGTAALIASYSARNGYIFTAAELRQLLKDTADDIYTINPTWEGKLGTGRVNAYLALLEVQAILGTLQPYNVLMTNTSGDQYPMVGETVYYALRIRNMGALNDAYQFSISGSGWAEGIYADVNDTPIDVPLVIESMESEYVYLKVTVPIGTEYWDYVYDTVDVVGTEVNDSVTVKTTASSSFFVEDFYNCDHGWSTYQTNLNYSGDTWLCEEIYSGGYGPIHYAGNDGTERANSYIVSPQISIPADGTTTLYFWSAYILDGGTYDTHSVRISKTTDDPSVLGAFALLSDVENTGYDEGYFYGRSFDLTQDYAGEDIYIAFQYRGADTGDIWTVTNVDVYVTYPYSLPFTENFDDTSIPDWTIVDPIEMWGIYDDNEAGGEPFEIGPWWVATTWSGISRLYTPELDIAGIDTVEVSFKSFHVDWTGVNPFKVKLQYSIDETNWIDTGWEIIGGQGNGVETGPETVTTLIRGLSSYDSLYVSWTTDGDQDTFYYWKIDDIEIKEAENYQVSVSNITGDSDCNVGESVYYQLKIENTGANNDNFYISSSKGWGDGFYTDDTGTTPISQPISINSEDYEYVYLKVTVPSGTPLWRTDEELVEVTGTGSYDSITITTTAVHLFLYEDFAGCDITGWQNVQTGTAKNSWECVDNPGSLSWMKHTCTEKANQTANTWLVTPQIHLDPLSKGYIYLYFWSAYVMPTGQPTHSYDYHGVYISELASPTPGNLSDWVELQEIANDGMEDGYFYSQLIDISSYHDKDVYIAFVYHGGSTGDEWYIANAMVIDDEYWLQEHTATITVRDNITKDPLPGMNVWLWNSAYPSEILLDADTDANGQVSILLPSGNYAFDVYDYYGGYDYYDNTFSITTSNVNINADLTLTNHTVTWEILDSANSPIAGAVVDITGADNPPATNASGITTTTLTKGNYPYTVSLTCYETISSDVDIAMAKSPVPRGTAPKNTYYLLHNMEDAECKVTFTVTDGSEGVMGAKITIDGLLDQIVTDSTGYAETWATCGSYDYLIEAGNYNPYSGSFIVDGTKANIHVELSYDPTFIQPAISLGHPEHTGIWLWSYDEAKPSDIGAKCSNWTNLLQGVTAEKILAGDITGDGNLEIVSLLDGYGLWYYSFAENAWKIAVPNSYSVSDFTIARTSQDDIREIVVSIEGYGLYKWDHSMGNNWPGAWQSIINIPADIMIASNINRDINGIDEIAVSFTGYSGLYVYSFETDAFNRVTTLSPSQIAKADITDDGYDELVMVFDGYGIYLARFEASGTKSETGIYPQFDLARDIKAGNEWISKGENNIGLQFSRISLGTPDAGHQIGTGDISQGFGSEIFITFSGNTYYYSYDGMVWSVLAYAPFKRIISSTFTGDVRNDLIVCDSTTGSIYLYKTDTQSWELLVAGGDTNAMTALK